MSDSARKNSMDAGSVVTAAIMASAVGALFYNLLPLYLGTAQDYRGLDNRAIGFLTSTFFIGYNAVTISAFFWIRRVNWRYVIAASVPTILIALYIGTSLDSYTSLLISIAVAGGAFAAIYCVGTTILGDTSNPHRWYAVKIAAESLSGAALLLILPSTAIAHWGFNGTVLGMIIAILLLSPFLLWTPARGNKRLEREIRSIEIPDPIPRKLRVQTPYIWGAILALLIFCSGVTTIWAFVERIGANGGHDAAAVGLLLSVSLMFAVAGSLAAAVMGGHFGNVTPFIAGAVVFLASLAFLSSAQQFALYATGTCMVAFAFGFMVPIAITEIAQLDFDGRYVVLSVPAFGIGSMLGPGITGLLTQSGSYTPLLVFCAAVVIVSSALLAFAATGARTHVDVGA